MLGPHLSLVLKSISVNFIASSLQLSDSVKCKMTSVFEERTFCQGKMLFLGHSASGQVPFGLESICSNCKVDIIFYLTAPAPSGPLSVIELQ